LRVLLKPGNHASPRIALSKTLDTLHLEPINALIKVIAIALPLAYYYLEKRNVDILSSDVMFGYLPVIDRPAPTLTLMLSRVPDKELYAANGTVITCGNFNFSSIDWSMKNGLRCSNLSASTGIFIELYYTNGLQQVVTEPATYEYTSDLIVCNNNNGVKNTPLHLNPSIQQIPIKCV
jgi:hypothetical protein